jgi:hypothetical protein
MEESTTNGPQLIPREKGGATLVVEGEEPVVASRGSGGKALTALAKSA